ncbi:MAG: HigA family addiction module antidote protein [Candidatus Marinimicrobia bacterium]|nr:HigA family addiction module antidote protein [Candidatus Neomarinimicrobiota bacterium]
MVNTLQPFINIGPGEFIREELDERGWRQEDLADILGMNIKSINMIIKNKQSITPETARLLSKTFGQSPQYWLNLDSMYRLQLQEESQKEAMVELKANIYKYMPIQEMVKKDWICARSNLEQFVKEVQRFWNTQDLSFDFFNDKLLPQFRKSSAYGRFNNNYALCWYRMAQRSAKIYESSEYDKPALKLLASQIHTYTVRDDGIAAFTGALEQCGVKFFVLSHLQKTYTDGASFLDGENPVIVYTKRYDRNDNFWFTIAHEIAHVLRHLNTAEDFFIDNVEERNQAGTTEQEANEFASELLKSKAIIDIFELKTGYIQQRLIYDTAEYLHLHPGIIVGILQHNDLLSPSYLNRLKDIVSQSIPDQYYAENYLEEIRNCA